MNKAIYLSYDLGLKGDYNKLYIWLDSLKARECGDNIAFFQMSFDENDENVIYETIKNEISTKVRLERNDRIYVIFRGADGQLTGKFLFGGRKRSPWEGFAVAGDDSIDEEPRG